MMQLKIVKILNNSTVLVDDNGKQKICMGNGIGFSKKPGDLINNDNIEKIFESTDNVFIKKMTESVKKINEKYYYVVDKIIEYANKTLDQKMPDFMYITLADHLFFAKERFEKGIVVPCPMKTEIKILYKKEFLVASKAVEIANKELGTNFDDNESGLIAMHIMNVTMNSDNSNHSFLISVVSEIVEIISNYFDIELDENSLAYARLITHLHFLSLRMFNNDTNPLHTPIFSLDSSLVKARCCADEVSKYLKNNYNYKLSNNELLYLALHIQNCVDNA
ncbi:MAG: PRD domain-containing protein [Firmicutes bacterium]|nr:PRD domain-containing protein [Candidatus Colivicinus equi]